MLLTQAIFKASTGMVLTQIVCNLFSLQIRRNVLSIGLCARKRLIGLAPEGGSS